MRRISLRPSLHQLHKAAYRRFPRFFSDPDYERHLEIYRSRDAEENLRSQPQNDETVQLHCVWAIEYYFPSHNDWLFAAFSKLGWDREESGFVGSNPAEWLRKRKETISGGGWFNLGPIDRPGVKAFGGPHRTAPLPDDVVCADGRLYALTSGISCIVIMFSLNEQAAGRYEDALRRGYQTVTKPRARGYEIIGPELQKERAIRDARRALRAQLRDWFQTNLPGYFSSDDAEAELPVCEFLTVTKARPFPSDDERTAPANFSIHALGLGHDFDAWADDDIKGLRFGWPLRTAGSQGQYAVIAANRIDFTEEKLRAYGGSDDSALPFFLNARINSLLSRWSLSGVLAALERNVAAVQTSLNARADSAGNALRTLAFFADLSSKSVIAGAVAAELERFSTEQLPFSHDVARFTPCRPEYYPESRSLSGILRENINRRSKMLARLAVSNQELLTQQNAAVGTRENVRLQRVITRLTWIIVALTAFMAWNAFREVSFWSDADNREFQDQSASPMPPDRDDISDSETLIIHGEGTRLQPDGTTGERGRVTGTAVFRRTTAGVPSWSAQP